MTMIENEHFNCMQMVSCKVTMITNDNNRKLGGTGVGGHYQGDRGVGVYWGTGRDCRYSGARRGIGASGVLGTPRGVGGCLWHQGV